MTGAGPKMRVAIVGCGEVTQLLHLPALAHLADLFEVAVLCDASATVRDAVGARVPGAVLCADWREACVAPDVDVVLVANPNPHHAPVALAAARAGKHVLIEKPAFVTTEQATQLLEAEASHGVVIQVGYMRRHAEAYREAAKELEGLQDQINLVRVHDVIGPNAAFTSPYSQVVRGDDIAPEIVASTARDLEDAYRSEIGHSPACSAGRVFALLLGLSSHSTSAMRGLIGAPNEVLYAQHTAGERMVTAAFGFDGFVCHYECGVDDVPRFGSVIEVYAKDRLLRLDYDTPYIRNLPVRLAVTRKTSATGWETRTIEPSREDLFVREWRALHDCIMRRERPATHVGDALEDLTLFKAMIKMMPFADAQGLRP